MGYVLNQEVYLAQGVYVPGNGSGRRTNAGGCTWHGRVFTPVCQGVYHQGVYAATGGCMPDTSSVTHILTGYGVQADITHPAGTSLQTVMNSYLSCCKSL